MNLLARFSISLGAIAVALAVASGRCAADGPPVLVFACRETNDLFRAAADGGVALRRYDSAVEALANAPNGAALLLLAEGYPEATTSVPPTLLADSVARGVRVYLEYPAALPGLELGPPRTTAWERAVVASDLFGPELPRLRILAVHGGHFVPARVNSAHLVVARVAGFDTAVFGLPPETWPLLFELPGQGHVLVATTKLSQFVTARYGPTRAWRVLWPKILAWLQPGKAPVTLRWEPAVRPTHGPREPLPPDAEERALRRGAAWYFNARMFIHPS
jgi:hypothetical protein